MKTLDEIISEHFDGDDNKALRYLYKIQKHNNFIYEEHMRMERYDKADVVMSKIKSNDDAISILNQNKDE